MKNGRKMKVFKIISTFWYSESRVESSGEAICTVDFCRVDFFSFISFKANDTFALFN